MNIFLCFFVKVFVSRLSHIVIIDSFTLLVVSHDLNVSYVLNFFKCTFVLHSIFVLDGYFNDFFFFRNFIKLCTVY